MAAKAPPPLPSRERRQTLSEELHAPIQNLQIQEQSTPAEEQHEEQEDFTPIQVQNGEPLIDQQVAPTRYLWYSGTSFIKRLLIFTTYTLQSYY
jgi:hypothetical protein